MKSISREDQFRFTYRSLDFASKAASRLKNAMRKHRPDFRKGTSQAFVAHIGGYRDWTELAAHVDPASTDLIDQDLAKDALIERRVVQIERLIRLSGMEHHTAATIIHDTEPTGSCTGHLRLWAGNMEPYFNLDPLPEGAVNMGAFEGILAKYAEGDIPVFRSLSYLATMLTETDTDVQVRSNTDGTFLVVMERGRDILSVHYSRHIHLNVWNDGDKPLRPEDPTLYIDYALWEMARALPARMRMRAGAVKRAYEAAGYFILADIMLTACLHSQLLGSEFVEVAFDVDVIDGEFGMEETGDAIASAYEEVLNYEDELLNLPDEEISEYSTDKFAIAYSPLQKILPFYLITVADK